MVEFRGSFTWKDSIHASWLSTRPRTGWALVGLLLIGLGLWALYFSWANYLRDGSGSPGQLSIGMGLLLAYFAYQPWDHYRAFRRSKLLSLPVTMSFSQDGIGITNEFGSANYPWSIIERAVGNDRIYMLYDAVGPFIAIPKRFARDQQDIERFHELLRTRGLVA